MLYKLKTSKVFDETQRSRDIDDDDCPFAVHRMYLCVDSRLLCVAGNSHVLLFHYSKLDASIDFPVCSQFYFKSFTPNRDIAVPGRFPQTFSIPQIKR